MARRRADGPTGGAAHGGAAGQLGRAFGTRVSVGRCQGVGQVALEGSLGPLGRGCAVDEVHRRRMAGDGRKQSKRARPLERDGGEGISAISEIPGTCR